MGNINNGLEVFESTFLYLQKPFNSPLDIKNNISVVVGKQVYFDILFSFSFDGINYSEYIKQADCVEVVSLLPIYVSIYCKRIIQNDLATPKSIYEKINVNPTQANLIINKITYQEIEIPIDEIKYKTVYEAVSEYPRWNFYDNQDANVQRWLKQCSAISEMYGLTCIYFKTEPVATETVHTFSTYAMRNVVNIKKIHFLIPDNELPEDRANYTDWDFALQDDFIVHIVNEKFVQAFGNVIPSEKDYLYFPMVNKLFRINTQPQPKKGFMGKSAWWEVYLAKFEDDDTVKIDDELRSAMTGMPGFDEGMDMIETDELSDVLDEIDDFKSDTIRTKEWIDQKTVEEKKIPSQNFTNKLEDSTFYVSLKETEVQREFYNKKLAIVSISVDNASFPTNMYNCNDVQKRVVAMQYSLKDYTTKNKFSTIVTTGYQISFNFVLMNNFVGEMFDFISNIASIFTIRSNRNTLELIDQRNQITFPTNFKFTLQEFYQIVIDYSVVLKQFSIKIFSLVNKEKNLEFQNIYIVDTVINQNISITGLDLFGGSYLVNDVTFIINDKIILKDICNPLLQMNKFG